MTLYVGIDVAKRFHVAALVGEDGEVLHPLRFDNDAAGTIIPAPAKRKAKVSA